MWVGLQLHLVPSPSIHSPRLRYLQGMGVAGSPEPVWHPPEGGNTHLGLLNVCFYL